MPQTGIEPVREYKSRRILGPQAVGCQSLRLQKLDAPTRGEIPLGEQHEGAGQHEHNHGGTDEDGLGALIEARASQKISAPGAPQSEQGVHAHNAGECHDGDAHAFREVVE